MSVVGRGGEAGETPRPRCHARRQDFNRSCMSSVLHMNVNASADCSRIP
jgi:hypothetical protein